MKKGYRYICLDGQWTIEGMSSEEGLLPRKAYEPNYQPEDRIPAQVPGVVQNHLFQAGRVEDPYWEKNNDKLLWVEEKEWWYFKDFTVPEDIQGQQYHIVLEGITYRANVWLDGVNIGNVEGMFLGIKHAMPEMAKGGGGAIVNISALNALRGSPNATAYCFAKSGTTQLAKAAALYA